MAPDPEAIVTRADLRALNVRRIEAKRALSALRSKLAWARFHSSSDQEELQGRIEAAAHDLVLAVNAREAALAKYRDQSRDLMDGRAARAAERNGQVIDGQSIAPIPAHDGEKRSPAADPLAEMRKRVRSRKAPKQ